MTASDGAEQRFNSLADRINYLFATVVDDDGDEYTGKHVVATMREQGTDISASHLSELRRGIKDNPTLRVFQGLARFFKVNVGFLTGDPRAEEEVIAELELRQAMRDSEVHDVATRVAGLAPSQRVAMNCLLTDMLRERSTPKRDE